MGIKQYNECDELSALRDTVFYKGLRPYIHKRLDKQIAQKGFLIFEGDEPASANDRYFAKLDIIFGQVFKNIQARQFWKEQIARLPTNEDQSLLSFTCLHNAYLNELVVLYERLQQFPVLLSKAYKNTLDTTALEKELLDFFSPILFDKRNHNHHRAYLNFPQHTELYNLEQQCLHGESSIKEFKKAYQERIKERLKWIEYTEIEMSQFFFKYLENIVEMIKEETHYKEPTDLPEGFTLSTKLDGNLRQKHKHKDTWLDE